MATSRPPSPEDTEVPPPPPQWVPKEDLARAFNTALVTSRTEQMRNHSEQLHRWMENPGFQAILEAIRHLALTRRITEKEAAIEVIEAFRAVDALWGDYVYQQGVERLKLQKVSGSGRPEPRPS